jgi:hypothetical protein
MVPGSWATAVDYTLPILTGGSHSRCGTKTILQHFLRRGYVWYMWSCLARLGLAVYVGTTAPNSRSTATGKGSASAPPGINRVWLERNTSLRDRPVQALGRKRAVGRTVNA